MRRAPPRPLREPGRCGHRPRPLGTHARGGPLGGGDALGPALLGPAAGGKAASLVVSVTGGARRMLGREGQPRLPSPREAALEGAVPRHRPLCQGDAAGSARRQVPGRGDGVPTANLGGDPGVARVAGSREGAAVRSRPAELLQPPRAGPSPAPGNPGLERPRQCPKAVSRAG